VALGAVAAGALDAPNDRTVQAAANGTPTLRAREGYCGPAGSPREQWSDPGNLNVGPLTLLGGRAVADAPLERVRNGSKLLALVRYGHRVTLSIGRESRSNARFSYGGLTSGRHGTKPFRRWPARLRFVACERVDRSDRGAPLRDGEVNANFWPGGIGLRRAPACVHLKVTVDNRAPVHRSMGFAMRCPTGTE
jgi:hypothetical protein